jgi:hypothetical protein
MNRFKQSRDEVNSNLKDLMTAIPMTAEQHAAIRRDKVKARRMVEDALEDARLKRDSSGYC